MVGTVSVCSEGVPRSECFFSTEDKLEIYTQHHLLGLGSRRDPSHCIRLQGGIIIIIIIIVRGGLRQLCVCVCVCVCERERVCDTKRTKKNKLP
jgi:hypothetical protein